jgi:hypothetical protein
MTRQIEDSRAEAYRMWLDAYKSILRVKRVQDKLIEQSQRPGCNHRIALWVEE